MSQKALLSVAILAAPETTPGTVFGLYDLFSSAGRDWDLLTKGSAGPARAQPRVIAAQREAFEAANGAWIQPHGTFDDCPAPDVVYVPEILVPPEAEISGRFDRALAWLQRCHGAGATLASACSGSLLLAEAGLLDGCEATTHWAYCDAMRRRYPKVTVHGARCLVASGEGQRIITSGGVTSYLDLGLFLAARFFGLEEAMRLARAYLIDWHRHGQLPFSSLACSRQVSDRQIATMQAWIADNYAHPAPVAAMIEMSRLPERSFKRRFTQATGFTPLDYVQALRVEEAKQLLETTDLPIEAVAEEVGYEDSSFFRRLFRRKVGLTPHAYRLRFSAFRNALADAG
ncbi:MAG TPA: helix-turn-helix domain-containing protein, partial [Alphaproteobacteria bacterium]|nr:helix-turn-helix domain-containing protein [Alphaproteobacteria bacterium]